MGNTPTVPLSPNLTPLGQTVEVSTLNIDRPTSFAEVGKAVMWFLVSKFGTKAKGLKLKFTASLPSVDARSSGDGIRYYQAVPPVERVNKNRLVEGRKGVQAAVIKGEPAREHVVDEDGATNIFISPLTPTVQDVFDYIVLAVFETWSGYRHGNDFQKYCEILGYQGMPILDENGKETYNSKNEIRRTYKQVSRSKELDAEIRAIIEERGLTIPAPMDWQAFEMQKTQTRGTLACPSPSFAKETCPKFSISLKQAELIDGIRCKLHNLPLAFTGPATEAVAPAEGSQPSSTTAAEPAA